MGNLLPIQNISIKKRRLCSLFQNHHRPKILRSANKFDLSRFSNPSYSITTEMILSMKVSIESLNLYRSVCLKNLSNSFMLENPDSPRKPKLAIIFA